MSEPSSNPTRDAVAAAIGGGLPLRLSSNELAALAMNAYEANPPEWLRGLVHDSTRDPGEIPEPVRRAAGVL